jgi:hypothetical protein
MAAEKGGRCVFLQKQFNAHRKKPDCNAGSWVWFVARVDRKKSDLSLGSSVWIRGTANWKSRLTGESVCTNAKAGQGLPPLLG